MLSFHTVGLAALAFALVANVAAAQSAIQTSERDSITVRLAPRVKPVGRSAGAGTLKLPQAESLPRLEAQERVASNGRRDSIWNGALIGAGIGAASGAIWGRQVCGTTDDECFAIAGPAGIITGAGIGAAVGAVADLLND